MGQFVSVLNLSNPLQNEVSTRAGYGSQVRLRVSDSVANYGSASNGTPSTEERTTTADMENFQILQSAKQEIILVNNYRCSTIFGRVQGTGMFLKTEHVHFQNSVKLRG